MSLTMTEQRLRKENLAFAGTGGVSQNNRASGFVPGFCDEATGQVQISRFKNGMPAPFHLLDGLPEEWITERDANGRVLTIKSSVIAGFVHQDCFYTREQAARAVLH